MSIQGMWLGVAGGGGAIFVGGVAGHMAYLVNCAAPSNSHMQCVVTSARAGLAAHAGVGASIVVMSGINSSQDLTNLTSQGTDFVFDLGAKWGAAIKGGGRIAQAAKCLCMADDFTDVQKYVAGEPGKALINWLAGDLELSATNPSFAMLGTPFGAGVGAGVFYEWQNVYTAGSSEAWYYAPINWRLKRHNNQYWIQVRNIPADDGTKLVIMGKCFELGPDGVVDLYTSNRTLGRRNYSTGIVEKGKLIEDPSSPGAAKSAPPGGGINLSARNIMGVRNILSFRSIRPNSSLPFGLALRLENKEQELVRQSKTSTTLEFMGNTGLSPLTRESTWIY